MSVTGIAATSNVTYNGNACDFIFTPGSSYSPTDLFTNFKDVMPGATVTQTITVRNNSSNKADVKIYMRSLGAHNGTDAEFLKKLKLTVTEVGASKLFEAPADQTDGLTEWHLLGTLLSGGEATLDVTLEVPADLDNLYQKKIGIVDWEFKVEDFTEQPTSKYGGGSIIIPSNQTPGAKDGGFDANFSQQPHIEAAKGIIENVKEAIENLPFTGSAGHPLAVVLFLLSSAALLIAVALKKKSRTDNPGEERQD